MAGTSSARFESEKKKARIEIIPLIDVIFFLLATFVLFTLSLEKIKSVPVNLPVAGPPGEKNDDDVTIQVSEGTNVYWNKDLISVPELPSRIESYKKSVSNPRILIAGDDTAKYGVTVEVLDMIRKAGFGESQVSVETSVRFTGK